MDLIEKLNSKKNGEGDLWEKLNDRAAAAKARTLVLARLVARAAESIQREPNPRYQTPFSREIEGIDHLKNSPLPDSFYTMGNQTRDPTSGR